MSREAISTLKSDPDLGPLIEEHGTLTLEPADDTFRRLVVSVVRQQVSMAAARAIRNRLFDDFEITPSSLAAVDPEELTAVGLSSRKAEYVRNIAQAHLENGYGREYFAGLEDEEVVSELTEIRGVGDWTARMYLMFCLGREDVFPVEDLGIRKGMRELYHEDMTRREMREKAGDWRPYRSFASLYLWRAYKE